MEAERRVKTSSTTNQRFVGALTPKKQSVNNCGAGGHDPHGKTDDYGTCRPPGDELAVAHVHASVAFANVHKQKADLRTICPAATSDGRRGRGVLRRSWWLSARAHTHTHKVCRELQLTEKVRWCSAPYRCRVCVKCTALIAQQKLLPGGKNTSELGENWMNLCEGNRVMTGVY